MRDRYQKSNMLLRLIYINVAVFLVVNIIWVFGFLLGADKSLLQVMIEWLAVPSDLTKLLTRPWTVVTHMFFHKGIWHILMNLLWLYIFGRIFLQYLNEKRLLSLYLVGGFSGAALFILAFNVFPVFEPGVPALGASAAIMAVVVAIAYYRPNYTIHLLFLGPVKIKYIAIFALVIDFFSIPGQNAGGHIAHLGGAIFGFFYIYQLMQGVNITRGFDRVMDNLFALLKPRPRFRVTHKRPRSDIEYNKQKVEHQKRIDKILEKISKNGYESLTQEEKEILFKQGGGQS